MRRPRWLSSRPAETPDPKNDDPQVQCAFCLNWFDTDATLAEHMDSVHNAPAAGPGLNRERIRLTLTDGGTAAWRPLTPDGSMLIAAPRKDTPMPEPTPITLPADTVLPPLPPRDGPPETERPTRVGRLHDQRLANDDRPDCSHCKGTGKELTDDDRTIRELLRESVALLGDNEREHDHLVAEFYRRLFADHSYLIALFPPDLADSGSAPDGRGKAQRDRLIGAVLALGALFDPSDRESMAKLNVALDAYGRAHAAFPFPDGVRPPSLEEYAAVKATLFGLLAETFGERWRPAFTRAWSRAYDHAYRRMATAAEAYLAEQGAAVFPRTVRQ